MTFFKQTNGPECTKMVVVGGHLFGANTIILLTGTQICFNYLIFFCNFLLNKALHTSQMSQCWAEIQRKKRWITQGTDRVSVDLKDPISALLRFFFVLFSLSIIGPCHNDQLVLNQFKNCMELRLIPPPKYNGTGTWTKSSGEKKYKLILKSPQNLAWDRDQDWN